MARKRLAAEQIVTKLRQIEVLQGQGKTIAMACKEAGTTEQNSAMNASMVKSSTVSGKPKWSSRTGASTATRNVHTPRSVIDHLRRSPSHQNHPLSTRSHLCNNLSLHLAPNIGQANRTAAGHHITSSAIKSLCAVVSCSGRLTCNTKSAILAVSVMRGRTARSHLVAVLLLANAATAD